MQGLIFLLVYAAVMIAVTLMFTKKEKTAEGFLVGDRSMKTASSAMSIAATWIWAPALFVSAEKAYTNGIPGLFWFIVPNVLCLLLFIPFAKRIRKQMPRGITLSGYMAERYKSSKVKNIYLFQLSALSILSTGVQLLAGGKVMASLTGLPFPLMTILLALIAFSYSQFSGLRASVITDAVQMVFILAACAVFVPWALSSEGGIHNFISGLSGVSGNYSNLFDIHGLEVLFSFGLPTAIGLISGPFGDQCFWQRAFAIKENKIGRAFGWGSALFAVVPISMGILGFVAAGSVFIAKDTSVVNLELVTHLFPAWTVITICRYEGKLYRCLQSHTSQDTWTPAAVPSQWKEIGNPTGEWPEWSQPVGAIDTYPLGAKVSHNGKRWISTVDNNVWEPGVYGWTQNE